MEKRLVDTFAILQYDMEEKCREGGCSTKCRCHLLLDTRIASGQHWFLAYFASEWQFVKNDVPTLCVD